MKEQDAAHSFTEGFNYGGQVPAYGNEKTGRQVIQEQQAELTRLRSELQQAKQEIANQTMCNNLLLDCDGEVDLANKIYKLTSELQQKDGLINELVDVLDFYYSHGYIHGTGYDGNNEIESIIKKAKLNN